MSNSLCKSSVFKTYQDVISDVIQNVREHFLEDGIDETVLQELKSLWETKLAATKAVEEIKEVDKLIVNNKAQKLQQQHQQNYLNQIAQQQNQAKQLVGQVPPNNHIPQGIAFPEWRRVPVQLTIPSPPGCGTGEQRILGIEVPEVFLQGHHLKSILTGPIISETLNLPLDAATTFLQDQVNNAFLKHQQSTNFININPGMNPSILQADGCSVPDDDDKLCFPYFDVNSDNKHVKLHRRHKCINHEQSTCLRYTASSGSKENVCVKFKRKNTIKKKNVNREKNQSSTQPLDEDKQEIISTKPIPEPNDQTLSKTKSLSETQHKCQRDLIPINVAVTKTSSPINGIYQGDGMHSSSDEEDLDDEDEENENEEEEDLNDDIEEEPPEAAEDEPLNSEDDVSDADGTEESFETENVIVCQFDKITRARNRWKFHLKDGIMNLNGEDYVFQKANGEAEW